MAANDGKSIVVWRCTARVWSADASAAGNGRGSGNALNVRQRICWLADVCDDGPLAEKHAGTWFEAMCCFMLPCCPATSAAVCREILGAAMRGAGVAGSLPLMMPACEAATPLVETEAQVRHCSPNRSCF